MHGSTSKGGTWWRKDTGREMFTWHPSGHDRTPFPRDGRAAHLLFTFLHCLWHPMNKAPFSTSRLRLNLSGSHPRVAQLPLLPAHPQASLQQGRVLQPLP